MDQHEMFTEVVANVAKMCAVSAMTAPKSGGQLFLKGSNHSMEPTFAGKRKPLHPRGNWLRGGGKNQKTPFFSRAADGAERGPLIFFRGLERGSPPMYDCGACGYGTCHEF